VQIGPVFHPAFC